MTVSPFDHPLLSASSATMRRRGCSRSKPNSPRCSPSSARLTEAEAAEGIIEQAAADAIVAALASFAPDMQRLRAGVARDGVVVPELVRAIARGGRRAAWRTSAFRRDQPGRHRHRAGAAPEAGRRAFRRQLCRADRALRRHRTPASATRACPAIRACSRRSRSMCRTASRRGGSRWSGIASGWRSSRHGCSSCSSAARPARWKSSATRGRRCARRWPHGLASATRRNGTASATASPTSPAGCR